MIPLIENGMVRTFRVVVELDVTVKPDGLEVEAHKTSSHGPIRQVFQPHRDAEHVHYVTCDGCQSPVDIQTKTPPPPVEKCCADRDRSHGYCECHCHKPSPKAQEKCEHVGFNDGNHCTICKPGFVLSTPSPEFSTEVVDEIRKIASLGALSDYGRDKMEADIIDLLRLVQKSRGEASK